MHPISAAVKHLWFPIVATLLAVAAPAQTNYQVFKSFGLPDPGTHPHSALLLGQDGALYGTTMSGGQDRRGTVFRMHVDGSGHTLLHQFSTNYDGKNPVGALIQGQDGVLYGTTVHGGSNRVGTVYSLTTNGSNYAILHHFSRSNGDGQFPFGRLVFGGDGLLYGTTSLTANNGPGMIYKLAKDGTHFISIHTLATNGSEGRNPNGLIVGQDGLLYGIVRSLASNPTNGAVFRIGQFGTGFTILTNIPGSSLRSHMNALRQATNGLLYGTVCSHANTDFVYSLKTNGGSFSILHEFTDDGFDGLGPDTQLLQGLDGHFYGTTTAGGTNNAGTVFKMSYDGGGYTILHHFLTNGIDGQWPEDSLIQASDGTLYGTTVLGGESNDGTVYSIHADGSGYTRLHSFNSYAAEGQLPSGSVASNGEGELFGTTFQGGGKGFGTLFKIGVNGSDYTVLRHFGGLGDGQWPSGGLLRAQDLMWYGTTLSGGINNAGTIFRINNDGSGYATLYNFDGFNEGDAPYDALLQDSFGILYGATAAGGSNGVGTLYRVGTNGAEFTVLHTFQTNKFDGSSPIGKMTLANDGFIYGVTEAGGTNNGGTVFKTSTNGTAYELLHHFRTNGLDGHFPQGVLLGRNGGLYGITRRGGTEGAGTLFTLNTDGSGYTILHNLNGSLTNYMSANGGVDSLVLASSDTLYGTIYEGGGSNLFGGLLFKVGTNGSGFSLLQLNGTNLTGGIHPSGPLTLIGDQWYGLAKEGGVNGVGAIYGFGLLPPVLVSEPQSQTVWAGSDVTLSAVIAGGPAEHIWYFGSSPLTNSVGLELTLNSVSRFSSGAYSLVASNAAGVVTSSNAVLTVLVPTLINDAYVTADGTFLATAGLADGWPLTSGDAVRFQGQYSSNLIDWTSLDEALSISNGLIVIDDPLSTNQPARFYRIVELPTE